MTLTEIKETIRFIKAERKKAVTAKGRNYFTSLLNHYETKLKEATK
ncbi:hypothetical protein [Bacillus phage Anath]|uniref:Uncharacterized protein n=1 Tax=Bacillus phage Anath TaxID=2108114 RepID=A0A2P1JUR2_9CAUD|nr:hypothetical protein [Bacillus phage Anath]